MKKIGRVGIIVFMLVIIMSAFSVISFGASNTTSVSVNKVTGVTLKQTDDYKIKVTWNKISSVTGYEVYRSTSKTGKYTLKKTAKKTTFTDSDTKVGKTYYYKVRAYKTKNGKKYFGKYSVIKSIKVKVNKVTGVELNQTGDTKNKLSWKKQASVTGYEIYKATSKTGKYTLKKTVTTNSFTDTGLKVGNRYYYKVRAYKTRNGKKYYGEFSIIKGGKKTYANPHFKLEVEGEDNYILFTITNDKNSQTMEVVNDGCWWVYAEGVKPDTSSDDFWEPMYAGYFNSRDKLIDIDLDWSNGLEQVSIEPGKCVTFGLIMDADEYEYVEGDQVGIPIWYNDMNYFYWGNSISKDCWCYGKIDW